MRCYAFVFAVLLGLQAPQALAQPSTCERLERALETYDDRAAAAYAEAQLPTRTGLDAGLWLQRAELELSYLRATLDLLAANRCPAPTRPLNSDAYLGALRACMAAPSSAHGIPLACDRSTWRPAPPAQ
jgi:hypothetical protein